MQRHVHRTARLAIRNVLLVVAGECDDRPGRSSRGGQRRATPPSPLGAVRSLSASTLDLGMLHSQGVTEYSTARAVGTRPRQWRVNHRQQAVRVSTHSPRRSSIDRETINVRQPLVILAAGDGDPEAVMQVTTNFATTVGLSCRLAGCRRAKRPGHRIGPLCTRWDSNPHALSRTRT